jgi:uncharacterized membrane protein YdbT with pleckstrin-like domain
LAHVVPEEAAQRLRGTRRRLASALAVFALIAAIVLGVVVVAMDSPAALKWTALILIVGCAVWVVIRYIKWVTTDFVITSDRVIFRQGVFAKSGIEIPLERVNSVHFAQSILERLVGAGNLLIESGAETGQQRFTDIHNPDKIQNLIHAQMEQNEKRTYQAQHPGASQSAVADVMERLERLEAMHERGTLTAAEFEAQKQRLLNE